MQTKKSCSATYVVLATFVMFLLAPVVANQQAQAQTKFKVLHTFHGKDGFGPNGQLLRDKTGYLYGVTGAGGTHTCSGQEGCGTAFKLDEKGKQVWVHSFNGRNGMSPWAGLSRDTSGHLYGATFYGGDLQCQDGTLGCGTVFRLDGGGHETLLYRFTGGTTDGWFADSPVVMDAAGNLYGTTEQGGSSTWGTIFKVDTNGKEKVLYSFTGESDRCIPVGVILDTANSLYGVTSQGGSGSCAHNAGYGVVFKLDSAGEFSVLHTFGGPDGRYPDSVLLLDADGNIYGTTGDGGSNSNDQQCAYGCGTVFKITPNGAESVLYNFCSLSNCADGASPGSGPLVRDDVGNIYGTTARGGAYDNCNKEGCGVVFELDTSGKERVLHRFSGGADGWSSWGVGLVMDHSRNLYGVATLGGDTNCDPSYGCGVVFRVSP